MRRAFVVIGLLALLAPLTAAASFASDRLWTGSHAAEARAQALLTAIRAAGDHGLKPEWYRIADLEKALEPGADRDRAEQLLSDAFVTYASDISTGRVRANSIDRDIDIQQRRIDRAGLLKEAADAGDFPTWLASLPPKGDYPALQKTLATLRQKRATAATFTSLPYGDALKPGMIDPRVPMLRQRLAELEMTVPAPSAVAELYDDALAVVVKDYQAAKGLTVDGVIGAKTTRSLNTSLDDRIDQVVANLERRRWLPADLGNRYVLVNAADYSMVFVDGGQPVFRSLVIVGTPKNPTPEIASTMYGFQTNPYWTVPQSISGEEYLPILRRDPHALAAGGFRIFESWSDDDSEIDPDTVDWNAVDPKAFPYRIRQDPGVGNALGYIFFPFSNRYGIYMHDTATRALFAEGSRNFSHGCIRLQNPLEFVEKVFGGRGGFDKERVRAAIDGGQQVSYTFPEPVRLYVTYRTVTANADGEVTFRDDIYGRDRRVVQAMGQPRS
ncbi:L,D-transpeptidase family protein [Reyranella sp.]|uniref:L,D-transpeptidase family protein n=1 Tax=Reyranella sp. TaxID=1929291 RepID=UPI002F957489